MLDDFLEVSLMASFLSVPVAGLAMGALVRRLNRPLWWAGALALLGLLSTIGILGIIFGRPGDWAAVPTFLTPPIVTLSAAALAYLGPAPSERTRS